MSSHRRLLLGLLMLVGLMAGASRPSLAQAAGLTWGSPQPYWTSSSPDVPGGNSVSCASSSLCVVTGRYGYYNRLPYAEATTDPTNGTPSWASSTPPDSDGVSCVASTTLCVAVGNSVVSTSSAPAAASPTWTTTTLPVTGALTAVSCPTAAMCVTASTDGHVYASATPTGSASSWSDTAVDGQSGSAGQLVSLSCLASGGCAAVDGAGDVYWTADALAPSPIWTPETIDAGDALSAVTCASASLCIAADQQGNVLVSTSPASGAPWTTVHVSGVAVSGVSCISARLCVAVDASGAALTSTDGGSTWSPQTVDASQGLVAVSCTPGLCMAIDTADAVVGSTVAIGAPIVTTGSASAGQTTATINGTVDPNSDPVTACEFEYGTSAGYGLTAPCGSSPGAGGAAVAVSAGLTSLVPGTTYHYRLDATNSYGTTVGADATFTTATPPVPLSAQPIRQVVFVHGIRSGCNLAGNPNLPRSQQSYVPLYNTLSASGRGVYTFCYDHDAAYAANRSWDRGLCFGATSRPETGGPGFGALKASGNQIYLSNTAPLYASQSPYGAAHSGLYDGDGPLAYDATKLDACLTELESWDTAHYGHLVPIALIGNSMGGAITRGWLAFAQSRHSSALTAVTTVALLQPASEGSWGARILEGLNANRYPFWLQPPYNQVLSDLDNLLETQGIDPRRPGVGDLAPQSTWYRSVAAVAPPNLNYYTYSVNITLSFHVQVLWYSHGAGSTGNFLGDVIMQTGSPWYGALPFWGGSEFLPGGLAANRQSWVTQVDLSAPLSIFGVASGISAVLGQPYAHINFGNQIGHLTLGSCESPFALVTISSELDRIFGSPADACDYFAGAADLPTRQTVLPAASDVASATAAGGPLTFLDRGGRAQLSLVTAGSGAGRYTLLIPGYAPIQARLSRAQLRAHTIRLNVRSLSTTTGGRALRLSLRGVLIPDAHSARFTVSRGRRVVFAFVTLVPDLERTRELITRVAQALRRGRLSAIVGLLPSAGLPPGGRAAVSRQLAALHVEVFSVRLRGRPRLQWVPGGSAEALQSLVVRARVRGRLSVRTFTLTLLAVRAGWRVQSLG